MHYGGRCTSNKSRSGAKRINADIEKLPINKYWRAKRAEEAFIRGISVAAVLEPEYLHPASAVRSRGQLHSVNQYAAALLGGERVRADSNGALEHAILKSHRVCLAINSILFRIDPLPQFHRLIGCPFTALHVTH